MPEMPCNGSTRAAPQDVAPVSARTGAPSYPVYAEARWIGDDLLVWIWGGDKPHIGAVAAAEPRPSLRDKSKMSATASVLTYVGHKEDVVVKSAAEVLAATLGTRVVVTAGIHWDTLSSPGIDVVLERCREVIGLLTDRLVQSRQKLK